MCFVVTSLCCRAAQASPPGTSSWRPARHRCADTRSQLSGNRGGIHLPSERRVLDVIEISKVGKPGHGSSCKVGTKRWHLLRRWTKERWDNMWKMCRHCSNIVAEQVSDPRNSTRLLRSPSNKMSVTVSQRTESSAPPVQWRLRRIGHYKHPKVRNPWICFFVQERNQNETFLGKRLRYDEHVFQDWTKFERWANIWIDTVRNLKMTCKPEHRLKRKTLPGQYRNQRVGSGCSRLFLLLTRHVSLHSALDDLVSGGCPEVSLPTTLSHDTVVKSTAENSCQFRDDVHHHRCGRAWRLFDSFKARRFYGGTFVS